jgi:hypothetical protein
VLDRSVFWPRAWYVDAVPLDEDCDCRAAAWPVAWVLPEREACVADCALVPERVP